MDQKTAITGVYRSFVSDITKQAPYGDLRVIPECVDDTCGADFAFDLHVPIDRFEEAVRITSAIESEYHARHGMNFLVLPRCT